MFICSFHFVHFVHFVHFAQVSSISDVRFTADGRYVLSRDFLTLKVWDPRFEARPVRADPRRLLALFVRVGTEF